MSERSRVWCALLLIALGLLALGCSASVTWSGRLLQKPEPPTLAEDVQALALCAGVPEQQACAEAHLIRTGVKPADAAKRIFDALRSTNSARAGRANQEDGR